MKKKTLTAVLVSVMILLTSTVNAFAASPAFPYKLMRGVGNMYYYVNSTANAYIPQINGAADNWIYTGFGYNPIYLYPVSSNNGTEMDFYGKTKDFWGENGDYVLAETRFFLASAQRVYPTQQNWFYCDVYLNTINLGSLSATNRQGTICHEMGHVMGLNENNGNIYSIMCQTGAGRATQRVGKDDHDAINLKY
ncbi:MAG: hypothetical protein N2749_04420 [Clostridia bacterium]|nr:hypothetical protein [Clostridia bacterium]